MLRGVENGQINFKGGYQRLVNMNVSDPEVALIKHLYGPGVS